MDSQLISILSARGQGLQFHTCCKLKEAQGKIWFDYG